MCNTASMGPADCIVSSAAACCGVVVAPGWILAVLGSLPAAGAVWARFSSVSPFPFPAAEDALAVPSVLAFCFRGCCGLFCCWASAASSPRASFLSTTPSLVVDPLGPPPGCGNLADLAAEGTGRGPTAFPCLSKVACLARPEVEKGDGDKSWPPLRWPLVRLTCRLAVRVVAESLLRRRTERKRCG